jgi:hypothetical protein
LNKEVQNLERVNIYPNPSSDFITIENLNETNYKSFEIHNNLGAIVLVESNLTKKKIILDLSGFENGTYYISLHNANNEIHTQSIVIQR